jgi:hypothetical protein
MTPTGLSLPGVIRHWGGWNQDGSRRPSLVKRSSRSIPRRTTRRSSLSIQMTRSNQVIVSYHYEVERSSQIAEVSLLADLSTETTRFEERVSLRWILVHMLEETASHAGHLDVMRETIDGRTGDRPFGTPRSRAQSCQ